MAGSPPLVRPQADCAVTEEKPMESAGQELTLPPVKQRKKLRLRAETDALKTALREDRSRVRQLRAAEAVASSCTQMVSLQADESSPSSLLCSRAGFARENPSDSYVDVEDVVHWCQLRQVLNCHQEALESEHSVWQACLAQQEDEGEQVRHRLTQAEESQQMTEARIQHLMDIMVTLLSPATTDSERQELVQQQYAAMFEDLETADNRLEMQIAAHQAALEAERSENCRRALQLSDQQLRTKRLHDALCQLQSELFRQRTGQRPRKQPGGSPEDPVVRSSKVALAAKGSGSSAQEPSGPCLVPAESRTISAPALAVAAVSSGAAGVQSLSLEAQDNSRSDEKPSDFESTEADPSGPASATLSLGSESDPPPARARSTSRTPPPPGAAREGPLEDRSEAQTHNQLMTNSITDGLRRAEEVPGTPNAPRVPSPHRLRLLENLLRDVLEELSFEHIVTRLSHGYYEFGKSPAIASAHLCLEGDKQLLASVDGVRYEPFKEFISKLQERECHSSAMSREDMAVSASSASEALCGAMMDPSWTAAAQEGKPGSVLRSSELAGTTATASRTHRPLVARSNRRGTSDRSGQNCDRTPAASSAAVENLPQKGSSTSSSSSARSPQPSSARGRSPRGKAQGVANCGNTAHAGEQANSRVMSPTPLNSRRTRAGGVMSGGSANSMLLKNRADKKGAGTATPVRGSSSPQRSASGDQLSPAAGGGCPAPLSRSASSNAGNSVVAIPGGCSLVLSSSCLGGNSSASQGGSSLILSPGRPVPGSPCRASSLPNGGTSACFSPPRSAGIPTDARAQTPIASRALTPRAVTPGIHSFGQWPQVSTATGSTSLLGRSTPLGPATMMVGAAAALQEGQSIPGTRVWVATHGRETSGVVAEPRRFVSPPPGVSLPRTATTPVPSFAARLSAPSVPSILAPNTWQVTGVAPPPSSIFPRATSASPARPGPAPAASTIGSCSFSGWRPAARAEAFQI